MFFLVRHQNQAFQNTLGMPQTSAVSCHPPNRAMAPLACIRAGTALRVSPIPLPSIRCLSPMQKSGNAVSGGRTMRSVLRLRIERPSRQVQPHKPGGRCALGRLFYPKTSVKNSPLPPALCYTDTISMRPVRAHCVLRRRHAFGRNRDFQAWREFPRGFSL